MASPSPDLLALPLAQAPLTFVDVETTGLSPALGDRVCELAAVRFCGRSEVARLATLVNPLRPVSPGAYRVNGITAAMLAGAPTFPQVAPRLGELLAGAVLVAHNAPFDVGFLGRELGLAGARPLDGVVLDTLALARRQGRFQSHSLGAVAAELGVRTPGHRALADALTTAEVFWRLIGRALPPGASVADALRAQGGRAGPTNRPDALSVPPDLLAAAQAGQSLYLRYAGADGAATERWVDPIRFGDVGGSPCLVAFCRLRQEERTFRLDRILRWESGTPPPGVPPRSI